MLLVRLVLSFDYKANNEESQKVICVPNKWMRVLRTGSDGQNWWRSCS